MAEQQPQRLLRKCARTPGDGRAATPTVIKGDYFSAGNETVMVVPFPKVLSKEMLPFK